MEINASDKQDQTSVNDYKRQQTSAIINEYQTQAVRKAEQPLTELLGLSMGSEFQ